VTDRLWSKGIQFQSIYFEYVDRTFFMVFEKWSFLVIFRKMVVFGHFWKMVVLDHFRKMVVFDHFWKMTVFGHFWKRAFLVIFEKWSFLVIFEKFSLKKSGKITEIRGEWPRKIIFESFRRGFKVVPISIFVRTLEIGTLSVGPFDDSEFLNPLFSTLPSNCP